MVVYSHSRIVTYENCPYQYKLRYVDKVVPLLGGTIESYMGGIVHEALEWLYDTVVNHDLATKEELLSYYDQRWVSRWKEDTRVIKSEFDFDHYKKLGRDYVEKYYERYVPFNQAVTIGLEKRLYIDLPDGKKMSGIIDRLDKKSKTHFEVHDYKTSSRLIEQSQADMDRQLSLYAMAVHQHYPEVETIDLIWHFVKFDAEVKSIRNKNQLQELALETCTKIDMIETAVADSDLPTSKSMLCDWCEYRKQCPEFGKTVDSEEIIEVIDKLVSITQSDIPEDDKVVILKTIEDKIKLFAQQSRQKTLVGTTHKATVEDVFERIPPDQGNLKWYNLQTELKNMNLEIGDLSNVFHTPELSEKQKNSLKGYFDIERSTKVVLEKL